MNNFNLRDWVVLEDSIHTPLQVTEVYFDSDKGEICYGLHNGFYARQSNLLPYGKMDEEDKKREALDMLQSLRDYCNQVVHPECDYSIYNQLIDRVDEIMGLLE